MPDDSNTQGAEPSQHTADPSKRLPSECCFKSAAHRARILRIAKAIKTPPRDFGPEYQALLDLLGFYTGTPHEKIVWPWYYEWSRPKQEDVATIEEAAAAEGMAYEEWLARDTRRELLRRARRHGLPLPDSKIPDPPLPCAPPLTEAQQEIYNLICREGPLTASQAVNKVEMLSSESNFTTHYVPALKNHGILNRRGLGYYHPNFYKPGPKQA